MLDIKAWNCYLKPVLAFHIHHASDNLNIMTDFGKKLIGSSSDLKTGSPTHLKWSAMKIIATD